EFHHRCPFARIVGSRLAIQSRLNQTDPVIQSLGCLCIDRLTGFTPIVRVEPRLSILAGKLVVASLNSFRTAVWITVIFEFRLAPRAEIEIRNRDEMDLRIKIPAVL